jgi:hypothetical protein
MAFAQPRRAEFPSPARSPRLAILRPDSGWLGLLGRDPTRERSYSQSCRDWPEVKSHLAILLAPPDRQSDEPGRDESGQEHRQRIWGLGIVRPAHETDWDRKVFVTHARRLLEQVPVSALWSTAGAGAGSLSLSLPESGPVTVGADTVFAGLLRISAAVAAEVQRLTPLLDDGESSTDQELRWRDERDALLLFAKIAGVDAKDFTRAHPWDRTAAGESYISGLDGVAVQPTLDDRRERVAERLSGIGDTAVRAFARRGGRGRYDLEAVSIIDPRVLDGAEGSLDAYYYHDDTETLVVLRYLSPGPDGIIWPEAGCGLDELHGRLRSLGQGARSAGDYRLLDDPLFVRVHEQVPFTPVLHRTSSGAIFPYGQFAAVIPAAGAGLPGPSADALTRHLVPTGFADLVRDGWFGARPVPMKGVLDSVKASVETVGAVLLVVDFSERARGNGSGLGVRT